MAEFDQPSAQTFLWEGMSVSEDRRPFLALLLDLAARRSRNRGALAAPPRGAGLDEPG